MLTMFKPKEYWESKRELDIIVKSTINNIKTCDIKVLNTFPSKGIFLKDLYYYK